MTRKIITLPDGDCYLVNDFLTEAVATKLFVEINQTATWHQPQIKMFGKTVHSPRLAAWYGERDAVYRYSGMTNQPLAWFDALQQLRARVEKYCDANFNSVLLNLYRDGKDAMGWHSDDEPELARDAAIASISLGATRRFVLRHRRRKDASSVSVDLHHGSLLVMQGATQRHWRHAVPRTAKPVGARINLTFRQVTRAAI